MSHLLAGAMRSSSACLGLRRAALLPKMTATASSPSDGRQWRHQSTGSDGGSGGGGRSSSFVPSSALGVTGALMGLAGVGALALYKKANRTESEDPVASLTSSSVENKLPAQPDPKVKVSVPSGGFKTTSMHKDDVPNLPKHANYLLVGAGTASFAAFRAIRARDPTAKILIIGDESRQPYMRPPLSKELWYSEKVEVEDSRDIRFKQWNGRPRSLFFESPAFYAPHDNLEKMERGGVAVVTGRKVVRIDATNREAHLDNGAVVAYDKCLLATGGKPKALPVLDKNAVLKSKVSLYRNVDDYMKLEEMLKHSRRIAIIGGGFLGSELACALAHNRKLKGLDGKLEVVQVFPESGNMARVLPDYLSEWTTEKVRAEGVRVVAGAGVASAYVDEGKLKLALSGDSNETLEVDHAVVAVGIEPNTDLAGPSRLEVDESIGGFRVNAELEARSNLWAAGDAASFFDPVLGRRRVEHHDHAVVSGRLAGENMTGAGRPYTHQSMFWSDLGPEVGYEAIGLVDSTLQTVGVFAKASKADSPKAVSQQSGEAMRSDAEAKAETAANQKEATAVSQTQPTKQGKDDKYGKGVIFYLSGEGRVVGLLMWNVFNRMGLARKIIRENRNYEDLTELAKLFNIHDEPQEEVAANAAT